MAGWARAQVITVNTLDSGSEPAPLCTLEDAVTAANTEAAVNGCPAGTGNDTILFSVTGTIYPDNALVLDNPSETLSIDGPAYGGITIDGQFNIELIEAEDSFLGLSNLTLTEGVSEVGGALFAGGAEVFIEDSTFVDNEAGEGGAIFGIESEVYILNSTFSEDEAEAGGAIANEDALFLITNCTFDGNLAEYGADIATEEGESLQSSRTAFRAAIATKLTTGVTTSPTMVAATFPVLVLTTARR